MSLKSPRTNLLRNGIVVPKYYVGDKKPSSLRDEIPERGLKHLVIAAATCCRSNLPMFMLLRVVSRRHKERKRVNCLALEML